MDTSSSTRERIIDAAMQLFGERGYRGTSVAEIERAADLSPGLLSAGIERHLARLDALRAIRRVLTELDDESELLRILVSEARAHPQLVETAGPNGRGWGKNAPRTSRRSASVP